MYNIFFDGKRNHIYKSKNLNFYLTMSKSNKIAAIILGAAGGFALIKFLSMPQEKRNEFYTFLKNKTNELLDNVEETVENLEHYMDEFQSKGEDEWIDKIYILKKMFKNLYGSDKHYLL